MSGPSSTGPDGTFLPLPSPRLTLPAEPEESFPVRHNDWTRLRAKVADLANPLPYLTNVAWTSIGVSASAALAYFPWAAAKSQLPEDAQMEYAYVSPLLIVTAIATAVLAIYCFRVNRTVQRMRATSTASVCDDMDAIYSPHVKQPTAPPLT